MNTPAYHSMDSTHHAKSRSFWQAFNVTAIAALGCVWLAGQARADGDPASDVLTTQPLFLPQDAGASATQQAQLAALMTGANRRGYAIRAALIASPSDLGSVTELWREPQTYARFLGIELSELYRGTLLVVMPNGYGLYGVGGARVSQSVLQGLSLPGSAMGTAAITAIRRLAAASGYTLPSPSGSAPSSTGSTDPVPWIVFFAGAILVALAWVASLRARPLGASPRRSTPA